MDIIRKCNRIFLIRWFQLIIWSGRKIVSFCQLINAVKGTRLITPDLNDYFNLETIYESENVDGKYEI